MMKTISNIYIHIPFCLRKCNYCSFYSEAETPFDDYFVALKKEIRQYQKQYRIKADTIYFGGGTPSLVKPSVLQDIISLFDLKNNCEITLEANPITITEKYTDEISLTKINRVSLGVQSFIDKELEMLGRLHKTAEVDSAIKYLKNNGINNISLDLMYGLPFQKKSDLLYSLEKIIAKNPVHISTYCLSLEKDVPMYFLKKDIPDDEIVADFYQSISDFLVDNSYNRYEISNFSKKGFESKHNLSYWNLSNYLGFGASASGFVDNLRYVNFADTEKYINAVNNSKKCYSANSLTANDRKSEYIFLGLRKSNGISFQKYNELFNSDIFRDFGKVINKYVDSNFLVVENDNLKLAEKSYFISNEIFSDFIL